jgi:hypothetical protein
MTTKQWLYMGGAIIVLSIIIGLLLQKGCNKKKEIVLNPTKQTIDSANDAQRAVIAFRDSMIAEQLKVKSNNDSLKKIVKDQSHQLDIKNVKISALLKEAAIYKRYNDTIAYVESCDILIPEVERLMDENNAHRKTNYALQNSLDSAVGQGSFRYARIDYEYDLLKARFDGVAEVADQLVQDNRKLDKKANKRFVFGPQTGVMYDIGNGKFVPYIGFGATYRLIAF